MTKITTTRVSARAAGAPQAAGAVARGVVEVVVPVAEAKAAGVELKVAATNK